MGLPKHGNVPKLTLNKCCFLGDTKGTYWPLSILKKNTPQLQHITLCSQGSLKCLFCLLLLWHCCHEWCAAPWWARIQTLRWQQRYFICLNDIPSKQQKNLLDFLAPSSWPFATEERAKYYRLFWNSELHIQTANTYFKHGWNRAGHTKSLEYVHNYVTCWNRVDPSL